MVIQLDSELEAALHEQARRQGVPAQDLAVAVLRGRFLGTTSALVPQDEWERRLLGAARDWGSIAA